MPAVILSSGEYVLCLIVAGLPETVSLKIVGEELLSHEVSGIIVGVFIVCAVAEIFHQRRGGVADVERHGLVARSFDFGKSGSDRHVGRVAFLRSREVDGAFGKRNASFRHPDLGYGVECSVGEEECVGVGESDVFSGEYHESSGNEFRVFASGDHACKPIECGIWIAASDAFDKRRYYVVVHFTVFVIGLRVLLKPVGDSAVVDEQCFPVGCRLFEQVDDVEQFAGVASRVSEQSRSLFDLDVAVR